MVKAANTDAIAAATGLEWSEWTRALGEMDAGNLDHNAIVACARQIKPISGWWAQSVAVAFEQDIGRRLPGQKSDGSFSASVSRTVPGQAADAFAQWCEFASSNAGKQEPAFAAGPKTSQTLTWYYWRAKYVDGSAVVLNMQDTNSGKTRIAVEHAKLVHPADIKARKDSWAKLLSACFSLPA